MNIIHAAKELKAGKRKVCLAIGFFDGVHLGHQQIIRQTIADARQHEGIALVITFDCHPNSVVAPTRVPPLIYSLPQKLRAIESLGAHTLLLIHFDKQFSELPGEVFVRALARDLGGIQSLCVGSNFVFGHKRGGNVGLLKKLGQELNFTVHGMASVALDGEPVSSTRVRETIASGELDATSQMLGRAYSLAGTVVRGDRFGHQIGFPTANLEATGRALPPNGVYAVQAEILGAGEPSSYRAVLNIGVRPTIGDQNPQRRVEVHLLDYQGELYEKVIEVTFVEKLRDEKKFASLDALREQIGRDIQEAQARF
jgi:riboflavin kinase/FMN adenylyltransferase